MDLVNFVLFEMSRSDKKNAHILEIRCRGSTVAELSKLTYVEDELIVSSLFLCKSLNFLQKAMVQYTIFKTVLLYFLKVYPSL